MTASDWKELTLDAVCSRITDGAHSSPPSVPEGRPMASVKDLTPFGIRLETCRRISIEDFEKLVRQGCQPVKGDVLIAKDGATALDTVCEVKRNEDVVLLSSVAILRPNPAIIDSSYLHYYLDSSTTRSYLKGTFVSGAAIPRVVLKDLKRAVVRVPPLPIQRRIAGILSAYDELIENSQRRIKILEALARAIYREWFVYFRFPGYESVPRVPTSLGEIPKGWEVRTVKEVAALVSRGPSLTYVDADGVPVVNQRCIRNEEIEMQAVQYAAPLSEKKSHLYLQPRDILINSMGVGTLGRVSRNLSIDEPTIIHNCITVVRVNPEEHTTAFLYYRLSDCQLHFESMGVGATGQTSLRIEDIEDVTFFYPTVALLSAFEEVALPMWTQIGVLKRKIQNVRRTRDLLLPRLLSGQLDVEAIAS